MFCDKCGKELAPGSIFCPNCGAKQLEEEPSAEMSASSSVSPVREAPSSQPSNQQSAERTTSPKHVTDESVYRKIICNNDILCFSAEAIWGQGDRVTKIGTTSLDMNEANTQAYGTYCDNLSNTGTVVLDFENGELYLTLVGNADHA